MAEPPIKKLEVGAHLQGNREYYLDRQLGAGTFGTVWLSHEGFAIKEAFSNTSTVNKEKKALSLMTKNPQAPRVPRFIEVIHREGLPLIVMEHVPGESANIHFDHSGTHQMTEPVALSFLWNCLETCKAMHKKVYIHRDIKPENIIIHQDTCEPWIVDFGIAKHQLQSGPSTNVGTPAFRAPDTKRKPYSDIFSLGATVLCLTKKMHDTDTEWIHVGPRCLHFSVELRDLLIKMVEPNHKQRFPTASATIDAFLQTPTGLGYCTRLSQEGNPRAQYLLGKFYYERKDLQKTVEFWTCAAQQLYPKAQFRLGEMLCKGVHVKQNLDLGLHLCHQATKQSSSKAQYFLGEFYCRGLDATKTYQRLQHRAWFSKKYQIHMPLCYQELQNHGNQLYYQKASSYLHMCPDPGAYFHLGQMYYQGLGVPRDENEAVRYFTLAAAQNHSMSQNNLGVIQALRSLSQGFELITQSSLQNNCCARNNLGVMYLNGFLVKEDEEQAADYIRISALQGNSYGQYHLGFLYQIGVLQQSFEKALEYYCLSANQTNSYGLFGLGFMYQNAKGVERDLHKAASFYTRSADLGNSSGLNSLGFFCLNGIAVKQNEATALEYFKMSSACGDCDGEYNLGWMYEHGKASENKNFTEALKWYTKSLYQGNAFAYYKRALIQVTKHIRIQHSTPCLDYFSCTKMGKNDDSSVEDYVYEGMAFEEGKFDSKVGYRNHLIKYHTFGLFLNVAQEAVIEMYTPKKLDSLGEYRQPVYRNYQDEQKDREEKEKRQYKPPPYVQRIDINRALENYQAGALLHLTKFQKNIQQDPQDPTVSWMTRALGYLSQSWKEHKKTFAFMFTMPVFLGGWTIARKYDWTHEFSFL